MTVAAKGESHGLGVGHGSLIEYPDGSVEFRQTGKLLPAFRVNLDDVRGFSVRRATRDDKKRLKASSLQEVVTVQGLGTVLAEVPTNMGTGERIEKWFRAHPRFGGQRQQQAPLITRWASRVVDPAVQLHRPRRRVCLPGGIPMPTTRRCSAIGTARNGPNTPHRLGIRSNGGTAPVWRSALTGVLVALPSTYEKCPEPSAVLGPSFSTLRPAARCGLAPVQY